MFEEFIFQWMVLILEGFADSPLLVALPTNLSASVINPLRSRLTSWLVTLVRDALDWEAMLVSSAR